MFSARAPSAIEVELVMATMESPPPRPAVRSGTAHASQFSGGTSVASCSVPAPPSRERPLPDTRRSTDHADGHVWPTPAHGLAKHNDACEGSGDNGGGDPAVDPDDNVRDNDASARTSRGRDVVEDDDAPLMPPPAATGRRLSTRRPPPPLSARSDQEEDEDESWLFAEAEDERTMRPRQRQRTVRDDAEANDEGDQSASSGAPTQDAYGTTRPRREDEEESADFELFQDRHSERETDSFVEETPH